MSTTIVKNVQLGADATPSNNFTWYQPSTPDGTVRLGNGNSGSATDLMTVNSSGNVGIGTSSPSAKLDVAISSGGLVQQLSGTSGVYTRLGTVSSSFYTVHNGTTDTFMYTQESAALRFGTAATERMRIDSSGNVGIGTSSPAYKLDVRTSVDAVQVFATNGTVNQAVGYCSSGLAISGAISNHPYVFLTNNTERARIDSSGNFGIGTSSPAQKLDVVGNIIGSQSITIGTGGLYQAGSIYSDGNWGMLFRAKQASPVLADFRWANSADTERMRIDSSGNLSIGSAGAASPTTVGQYTSGNNDIRYAWYQAGIAEMWIGQKANVGALCFGSGGGTSGELMRLDTSGNFIVGGTTASGKTQIYQTVSGAWAQHIVANNYAKATVLTAASGFGDYFVTSSGYAGAISLSGNTASYLSGSDYRLKDSITPLTGALTKVQALKPCTWKWKADGSDGEGFIAHELAEVCPQAVTGEKDAVDADGNPVYQGIDTSFLVATLTAAIQEQQAIITQLQADVAALKGAA